MPAQWFPSGGNSLCYVINSNLRIFSTLALPYKTNKIPGTVTLLLMQVNGGGCRTLRQYGHCDRKLQEGVGRPTWYFRPYEQSVFYIQTYIYFYSLAGMVNFTTH